ncbi:hypothetical protein GGF50DRAFT_116430 [Schizophyllum commune]
MFSYENLLEAGLRTVSFTAAGLGLTTAGLGAVAYQQWDEVTGLIADGFASFLGTPGSSDETRASTATSHDEIEGAGNVAANVNEAAHPEPVGKLGAVTSETSTPGLASASPFVTTENTTIEPVSSDISTDDPSTSFPLDASTQLPSHYEPDIALKMVEISATVFLLFVIFGTWFIRRKRLSFALSLATPSVNSNAAALHDVQKVLSDIEEEVDAKHAPEAPNVCSEKERADAPEDASKATPHVTVADEDPAPDGPVDEAVNIRDDEAVPAQPDDAPAPRTEVVPAAQRTQDVPIAQRKEVIIVAPRAVDVPVAPRDEDIPVEQTIDGHAQNLAVPTASASPKPALPPAIPLPQGAAVPLPQETAPVPPPQAAFDPPQQDEPDPPHAPATPPVPASPLAPASPTALASPPAPARLRPPTPELQAPAPVRRAPRSLLPVPRATGLPRSRASHNLPLDARRAQQAREAQGIQARDARQAREAGQEREEERDKRQAANEQEAEQAREDEQATQIELLAQAAPEPKIEAVAQGQAQADDPVPADAPAPEDLPVPAARDQAGVEQPDEARDVPNDAAPEVLGAVVRVGRDAVERDGRDAEEPEPNNARLVDGQPDAPEADGGRADGDDEDASDDDEGAPDVGGGVADVDEGAPENVKGAQDDDEAVRDEAAARDDGAAGHEARVEGRQEVRGNNEHEAAAAAAEEEEAHDEDDAEVHDAAANVDDGAAARDDGAAIGDVDGAMHAEGAVGREDEPNVANNEAGAGVRNDHNDHADDNAAPREGGAVARQGARVDVNPDGGDEAEGAEHEAEDNAQAIANAVAAAAPIQAPATAPMRQDAAPLPVEDEVPAPVEAVNPAPVHVDNPAPDAAAANPAPDAAAVRVPEQPVAAAEPVPEPAPAPPLVQPRRPLIWQPRARPVDPPVPAPTPFEQEHPAPFERSGLTKRTPTMPAYDPEQVEPNPHLEGFDDSEPEDVDDQRLAMWPVYGPAMKPVDDPLPEAANVGREGAEVRDGPAVVGAVVGEAAIENAGDSAEALGDLGADVEGEDAQVDAAPVPAHVGSQDQSKHALSPRPAEPAAYASTSAAAIKMDDGAFMKRDDDFPIASGSALPAVATSSTASPGPSSSSASCSNTVPAGAKVIELQGGPSKVDRKGKGRAVAPQEDEDRPSSLDDKPTEPPRRTDDAPFAAIDVGRLANITETDDSFDTETGSARQSLVSAVGGLAQTRGRARERAGPAPSDARQGRRASMQLSRNAQRASSSRRTKSADVQENKRPISARLRDGRTADSKSTQPRRVNSPNPTTGAGSAINVRGSRIATRSSSLNKQRPGKVDEQR